MATAAQVSEFRLANQSLVAMAQRDLSGFWSALNLSGDPARVREELLLFFPDLVQAYGDTAAVLGADWYELLRDAPASAASFGAVLAQPAATGQAQSSARWAVGPLWDEDPDAALSRLLGSTQRLVLQPGRDSFAQSAGRDPVRTAWARVPSGATTCKWCVMLAGRGADYGDAVAAGDMNDFHDNCDCTQVPIRSRSDWPEGYDLAYFQDLAREFSGVGRDLPAN